MARSGASGRPGSITTDSTGGGNAVGIAILDHPTNLRHPTWWHARDYGLLAANPFGQGKYEEEAAEGAGVHVIPNGEALTFRYRTIFHRGNPETVGIARAFEAFASKLPGAMGQGS